MTKAEAVTLLNSLDGDELAIVLGVARTLKHFKPGNIRKRDLKVLRLCYCHGCSMEDISTQTGLSVGIVTRICREYLLGM